MVTWIELVNDMEILRFRTFPHILCFRSSLWIFHKSIKSNSRRSNDCRIVAQVYLSCGVFSASSSRGIAIQFAESDFRSFETKRRSATRATAIGLRAMQRGPFVSDAIILSLFDSQSVSDSYQTIAQRAVRARLLYRRRICSARNATWCT